MKSVVFQNIFRLLIIGCGAIVAAEAFVVAPVGNTRKHGVWLSMANDSAEGNRGYKFGDLTRGVLKKVRGDEPSSSSDSKRGYKFGDLTRSVLEKAGVSSSTYKFGDISRWLDKAAKEKVSKFTNKENYQFGDMSREVVRRLVSGEYSRDDLWLFLKIVATIGINLQPVTTSLPLKVLLELLNMTMEASVAQSVGERVVSSITTEIDGRMKELVTGDRNYKLGDFSNRALLKWMGKDSYEFGDITKTYLEKREAAKERDPSDLSGEALELFSSKSEENLLEEWDKKLLESRKNEKGLKGMKDDESYRDWDEKFLSSPSGTTQQ